MRYRSRNGHMQAPAPGADPRVPSSSAGARNLWIVVPCMGRLAFLKQAAPRILSEGNARLCLVDYSCPEGSGDWLEQAFAKERQEGRVLVERVTEQRIFNKCRAHNAGAARAMREGADYLCFLDADTLVEPGFLDFVTQHAAPNRFLIAGLQPDGTDLPSMTGLLVVHHAPFERVGGFDEGFEGWGGEDIEFRLRLFLLGDLDYGDVPLALARPLQHADSLRSEFYEMRDIFLSNQRNMARIHRKLAHEWRGRCLRDPRGARRLWFKPPGFPYRNLGGPGSLPRPGARQGALGRLLDGTGRAGGSQTGRRSGAVVSSRRGR